MLLATTEKRDELRRATEKMNIAQMGHSRVCQLLEEMKPIKSQTPYTPVHEDLIQVTSYAIHLFL